MRDKIKQITIITQQGVGITNIGDNGIIEIIDESVEWENGIDFIYCCYGEDKKLIKRIENCPCDITFY